MASIGVAPKYENQVGNQLYEIAQQCYSLSLVAHESCRRTIYYSNVFLLTGR
jgi:hypothetical protein